jgi:uncharacterized protein YndB with AHSA1/START domain
MELKTKIAAEEGKHDLQITREFDLPVELLFKAFVDPSLVEQWMSNPHASAKVLKLESTKHGSFQLQSTDAGGNVVFSSHGAIHELIPGLKITRTFEVEGAPFGVQLEVYGFEKLTTETSRLNMHVIYETVAQRDMVLKMPFSQGINMAHNRIQEILNSQKPR